MFESFDKRYYKVLVLKDVKSMLEIDDVRHRYGSLVKAYRFDVASRVAEFLIVKEEV